MDLFITTKSERTPGPHVKIDCPKCGAKGTSATSHELRERLNLFFVLPVFFLRNTFVVCTNCDARLKSTLSLEELERHAGPGLSEFLRYRPSLVVAFLSIASVLLACGPGLGLIVAIIAVYQTRGQIGWMRTLSLVGLTLSAFVTLVGGVLSLLTLTQ